MYSPDQEVVVLWNAVASSLAAATYVFGGFMVVLFLLIAFTDFRDKRMAAKKAATVPKLEVIEETDDAFVPDTDAR
jgi:hypothetical protein